MHIQDDLWNEDSAVFPPCLPKNGIGQHETVGLKSSSKLRVLLVDCLKNP